jgi:hypothetical protein
MRDVLHTRKTRKRCFRNPSQQVCFRIAPLKTVSIVIAIGWLGLGCTIKVPMHPEVSSIEPKWHMAVEAALFIPEDSPNYFFKGYPESVTASARLHEFPLGPALEKVCVDTFSQMFEKVTVLRRREEAKDFPIVIEPRIEWFEFELGFLTPSYTSTISLTVNVTSGHKVVWMKSRSDRAESQLSWSKVLVWEEGLGNSASKALASAVGRIAAEMATDATLRQVLDRPVEKMGGT